MQHFNTELQSVKVRIENALFREGWQVLKLRLSLVKSDEYTKFLYSDILIKLGLNFSYCISEEGRPVA